MWPSLEVKNIVVHVGPNSKTLHGEPGRTLRTPLYIETGVT